MSSTFHYPTPLGEVWITDDGSHVTAISFSPGPEGIALCETPLIRQAHAELKEYFAGARTHFSFPVKARGTAFRERVWEELRGIPYGQTRTYGEIAALVGNPRAARAVGMASHHNPVGIVIPCHRVVGASGALTGYAGGLDRKRALLDLERKGLD